MKIVQVEAEVEMLKLDLVGLDLLLDLTAMIMITHQPRELVLRYVQYPPSASY
jgi:hypothetical protein